MIDKLGTKTGFGPKTNSDREPKLDQRHIRIENRLALATNLDQRQTGTKDKLGLKTRLGPKTNADQRQLRTEKQIRIDDKFGLKTKVGPKTNRDGKPDLD